MNENTRSPDQKIIVPSLIFNILGQVCLFILLITYIVGRSLPQRNNPYLVNMVVVSLLAAIPPALLFYSGYQYKPMPPALCLTQGVLVDGLLPMMFVGKLALVLDNWSELRHLALGNRHFTQIPIIKRLVLPLPYVFLVLINIVSAVAAVHYPGNLHGEKVASFLYCTNLGRFSTTVRAVVTYFLGIISVIHVFFEVWIVWIIYAYPIKTKTEGTVWRTTIQFAIRLLFLSGFQVIATLISLADSHMNAGPMKLTYELLTSMSALAVFIAFGTQKVILLTWKEWSCAGWRFIRRGGRRQKETDLPQPHGLPTLDWLPRY
ncbi:hypothetical protein M422DRAFT_776360 [Sphaerobolus stellatus SS14]|nr:hypothetical protein M422DRAFT_776360 [Sphaerobolus stellatus SS14]